MFIQPWDASLDRAEWQQWLAGTDRFGVLAVNNLDPAQAPVVAPTHFSLRDNEPPERGVPTSYYFAAQVLCRPTVMDDPEERATILRAQLGDFQPAGGHAAMSIDSAPYGRMLSGIRGLRLEERGRGLDHNAATQQPRRLDAVGQWQARS